MQNQKKAIYKVNIITEKINLTEEYNYMSDCENDKKKGTKGNPHSMKRMMILMVLCCGLPILLIAVLPFLNIGSIVTSVTLVSLITFLCPLMMLFMVPMMLKGSKEGKHDPEKKKHL
jgi:hypothetical protein